MVSMAPIAGAQYHSKFDVTEPLRDNLIFVLCLVAAALYFVCTARKNDVGPVAEVEGRKERFR